MFFQKFPTTLFDTTKLDSVVVTDFIRAVKIDQRLKEDDIFYDFYEAQDDEMPEVISHKFYKTTQYHWVIMLVNEKFDPWNDFPKSETTLIKAATEKYADINAVHHYQDSLGNVVDAFSDGIPITNIEYEQQENEKKRTVKILKRNVLDAFVEQYETLVAV